MIIKKINVAMIIPIAINILLINLSDFLLEKKSTKNVSNLSLIGFLCFGIYFRAAMILPTQSKPDKM